MIPKIIHYIWLSNDKKPKHIQKCIQTWKKRLPEYTIKCWDINSFDINSIPYVKEAIQKKRWAFAADYIRLYALYTEGGIYLDSDVVVKKSFDPFLKEDFFTGIEYHKDEFESIKNQLTSDGSPISAGTDIMGLGLQAAIMGGQKGNPFLKECLDYYQNRHFINNDGTVNDKTIAPCIYAHVAEKFGFKYKNERQKLSNNITIYESEIFAGGFNEKTDNSIAIHFSEGSWRNKSFKDRFRQYLTHNTIIRKIFGKEELY